MAFLRHHDDAGRITVAMLGRDSFSGYASAGFPNRYPGGAAFSSIASTPLPPQSQPGAQVLVIGGTQGPTAMSGFLPAKNRMDSGMIFFRNPAAAGYILQFNRPTAPPFVALVAGLWLDATGTFVQNSANTVVGTGAAIPDSEWHHWEFDVNFSSGAFNVYLDGAATPFITGTDASLINANARFFSIGVGSYSGTPTEAQSCSGFCGDFFVDDDLGPAPQNAPLAPQGLGAPKVAFAVSGGPGRVLQWTPNGAAALWQCVDQIPPDGDTTYAAAEIPSYSFMSTLGALPNMQSLIDVQVYTVARRDGGAGKAYQIGLGDGSTEAYFGSDIFPPPFYVYIGAPFPINPVTAAAWVVGDLAALQCGCVLTH